MKKASGQENKKVREIPAAYGREDRLSIRATVQEKALLSQAASLCRQNTSQFVLSASLKAAELVVHQSDGIVMSAEAYDRFAALLDEPPRPNRKLLNQLKRAGD